MLAAQPTPSERLAKAEHLLKTICENKGNPLTSDQLTDFNLNLAMLNTYPVKINPLILPLASMFSDFQTKFNRLTSEEFGNKVEAIAQALFLIGKEERHEWRLKAIEHHNPHTQYNMAAYLYKKNSYLDVIHYCQDAYYNKTTNEKIKSDVQDLLIEITQLAKTASTLPVIYKAYLFLIGIYINVDIKQTLVYHQELKTFLQTTNYIPKPEVMIAWQHLENDHANLNKIMIRITEFFNLKNESTRIISLLEDLFARFSDNESKKIIAKVLGKFLETKEPQLLQDAKNNLERDLAIHFYEKALSLFPEDPEFYFELARIQVQDEKTQEKACKNYKFATMYALDQKNYSLILTIKQQIEDGCLIASYETSKNSILMLIHNDPGFITYQLDIVARELDKDNAVYYKKVLAPFSFSAANNPFYQTLKDSIHFYESLKDESQNDHKPEIKKLAAKGQIHALDHLTNSYAYPLNKKPHTRKAAILFLAAWITSKNPLSFVSVETSNEFSKRCNSYFLHVKYKEKHKPFFEAITKIKASLADQTIHENPFVVLNREFKKFPDQHAIFVKQISKVLPLQTILSGQNGAPPTATANPVITTTTAAAKDQKTPAPDKSKSPWYAFLNVPFAQPKPQSEGVELLKMNPSNTLL